MDVHVRQLTAPLRVPDYRPYAKDARPRTLPAGTYWIKMAQRQKHWVQAMLNEDTYTPFPYFYDVTAWSLPLLADIDGGRSGALLHPHSQRVPRLAEPDPAAVPDDGPRIGVFQLSLESSSAIESSGWLRWLLTERWGADFVDVDATGIRDGALDDIDVLLVPNGPALDAAADLGVNGLGAIGTGCVTAAATSAGVAARNWRPWRVSARSTFVNRPRTCPAACSTAGWTPAAR